MTFTLHQPTALLVVFFAVAAFAVVLAVATVGSTLLQHRAVRVKRHQGVRQYYGHLVTGS